MARKVFPLEYAATCKDCGTELEPGAMVRYYGPGRVYGTECHPQKGKAENASRADAEAATRAAAADIAEPGAFDSEPDLIAPVSHGSRGMFDALFSANK